ncbi:MAG: hypothetical protein IJU70_13980 [Lentisphaeria bacterium]|nr:hypothetical protein [Lentisphaeria bacterium]
MLSLIISAAAACGIGYLVHLDHGPVWGAVTGALAFMLVHLCILLILRKYANRRQQVIQNILVKSQNDINRQIAQFQRRNPGSERAARQILEKIQNKANSDALAATEDFKKFYIWNFMLARQINDMKVLLLFQLKDYKAVDALLPSCLLMDPQAAAIKLVRMYKNDAPGLDKFYRKKCARFKGESLAFLASVYAWMLLKQNRSGDALNVLLDAKSKTDNPVVVANVDRLANGKAKQYSNAGFGDPWYVLGLEEYKVKPQRQKMGRPF